MEDNYEYEGALFIEIKCIGCDCKLKESEDELGVLRCSSCEREWEISYR